MHFIKLTVALISFGGAGYALYAANEAPLWLKFVSVTIAIASLIFALPELPRAIDAVKESATKLPDVTALPKAIVETLVSGPRYEHAQWAPTSSENPNCQVDPQGQAQCCRDSSKRLVIMWNGNSSPYTTGGISYYPHCQ